MAAAGPFTERSAPRWVCGVTAALLGGGGVAARARHTGVAAEAEWPASGPRSAAAAAGRRDWTRETLRAGVRGGDRRALARAISLVENGDPLAYELVRPVPGDGSAYAIG